MKLDTANILATRELQKTTQWEVYLPQNVSNVDSNLVSTFVQEVSFSGYNMNDVFEQRLGSAQMFSAGIPSIPTVTLSILSDVDGLVVKYFDDWRKKIFNSEKGFYYTKDNYAFTINCSLYDSKNNEKLIFDLKNAFPKTFPRHDLSYREDSFVTFKIEFAIDELLVDMSTEVSASPASTFTKKKSSTGDLLKKIGNAINLGVSAIGKTRGILNQISRL